jgi:hypothetical protein
MEQYAQCLEPDIDFPEICKGEQDPTYSWYVKLLKTKTMKPRFLAKIAQLEFKPLFLYKLVRWRTIDL